MRLVFRVEYRLQSRTAISYLYFFTAFGHKSQSENCPSLTNRKLETLQAVPLGPLEQFNSTVASDFETRQWSSKLDNGGGSLATVRPVACYSSCCYLSSFPGSTMALSSKGI